MTALSPRWCCARVRIRLQPGAKITPLDQSDSALAHALECSGSQGAFNVDVESGEDLIWGVQGGVGNLEGHLFLRAAGGHDHNPTGPSGTSPPPAASAWPAAITCSSRSICA